MSCKFNLEIDIDKIKLNLEGSEEFIKTERQEFNIVLPHIIGSIKSSSASTSPELINNETIDILPQSSEIEDKDDGISIVEFLNTKSFSTKKDITLGVAYCIQEKNEQEVNASSIRTCLKKAKIPDNGLGTYLYRLCQSGLMAHDSSNHYYVTKSGIEYVNKYTPKKEISTPKNSKTNLKSRKRKKTSDLLNISLEALNIEKYPAINDLRNFKEKAMMIMYIYEHEAKIDSFSISDIVDVMTIKFRESANKDKVTGVFRRGKTNFDKILIGNGRYKYKLLNDGLREVESIIEKHTLE